MQRKDYTPTKASKIYSSNQTYAPTTRETTRFTGQMTIVREYQALKLQAKQLEIQNRQLTADVEKLKYQKNMNESKMVQKAAFQEQAMAQFQKQKNYQIEMIKAKNEEDINRFRRDYENKIDDIQRQIKSRELLGQDLSQKYAYFENIGKQLRNTLQNLQVQLKRCRDQSSVLTEQLTKEEFANKKLQMLADELQHQKGQMQAQIHLLLDIEAQKSRTVSSHQNQIGQSQHSIANLHQKLKMLTDNFSSLDQHITVMKQRLLNAEMRGQEVDRHLQETEIQIADRQNILMQQKDRELRLRDQIEAHKQRQNQRLFQIKGLVSQNQRFYSEINSLRLELYDISIEQKVDI